LFQQLVLMRDDHGGNTTMSASAALAGAMPSDASTPQLCDYCAALVNASSSSLFIDAHQCLSLLATAGGAQFNATSLAHLLPEHCNYLQQHDARVCSQADSCWLVKIASRIRDARIVSSHVLCRLGVALRYANSCRQLSGDQRTHSLFEQSLVPLVVEL